MKIGNIDWYEIVIILPTAHDPRFVGKRGVVMGISYDESRIYSYQIAIDGEDDSYMFDPSEIEGTGKCMKREDLYSGETIRVKVTEDGDDVIGEISDT